MQRHDPVVVMEFAAWVKWTADRPDIRLLGSMLTDSKGSDGCLVPSPIRDAAGTFAACVDPAGHRAPRFHVYVGLWDRRTTSK